MLAHVFAALLAFAAPQQLPTQLSDVIVEGRRLDPLVTVSVTGDIPVEVIVRSNPVGVRCGEARFQYDPYAAPRLCWIRQPQAEMITLTAEGLDRLGPGWVVEWEGCVPQSAPSRCNVVVPAAGASVSLRVHRA